MISMINQDTTRAEKLEIRIEEKEKEIEDNFKILEKLEKFKTELTDDLQASFQMVIQECDNNIRFLMEENESDKKFLEELK